MKKATDSSIVDFIQTRFEALADPRKAIEMAAYMKTEKPFYGIQKPDRVPIYKELIKAFPAKSQRDYQKNVLALWLLPHREEKYAALEYACFFGDYINPDAMPLYSRLITDGAWWDFVDVVAIHLVGRVLKNFRSDTKDTIDLWSNDADMWIRRTSLICHNTHKGETDASQLLIRA